MKITIEDTETNKKPYIVTQLVFQGKEWTAKHSGMKNEWDVASSQDVSSYIWKGEMKYKWRLIIEVANEKEK